MDAGTIFILNVQSLLGYGRISVWGGRTKGQRFFTQIFPELGTWINTIMFINIFVADLKHKSNCVSGAMVARGTPNAEAPGSSPGCRYFCH